MMIIDTIAKKSPHLSWLKDSTIYLVQHGSKAYNCQIETSDDDFKGIAIPPKRYWYGTLENFEQAELKDPDPDCVIYNVRKWFQLAVANNPNILEMLFVEPQHRLLVHPLMERILEKRDIFLSKKARHSFAGFAYDQMRRVVLHRRWLLDPPKGMPDRKDFNLPDLPLIGMENLAAGLAAVKKETDKLNFNFLHDLSSEERVALKHEVYRLMENLSIHKEDIFERSARKIGMDDNLIYILQKEREYNAAVENWKKYQNWLKTRNPKRAADEAKYQMDLKFSYHIVRLYRTCRDLLATGRLVVYRPDREEIMEVREGKWNFEQLQQYVVDMEEQVEKLYRESDALPHHPDVKAIDRLCREVVEEGLLIGEK